HRVLALNFRCAAGEIDLVTLDGGTIVFVEVKTRRGSLLAEPDQAVNPAKRARLVRAARAYLGLHSGQARPCRFDVVWIVQDGPGRPNIQHIPDAFGATC
ncbi:MAG: YraN family protein, partial [Phycisphaerae bacterium]